MTRARRLPRALPAILLVAGLSALAAAGLTGQGGAAGSPALGGLVDAVAALVQGLDGGADGHAGRQSEGRTTPAGAAPAGVTASAAPAGSTSGSASPGAAGGPASVSGSSASSAADGPRALAWWVDPATGLMYGPDGEILAETYGLQGYTGSLAALLQALAGADPQAQARAAEAFVAAAAMSDMADVLAAALPGLYDQDPAVRYYSLVALGASALGSTANAEMLGEAVPHILGRLGDDAAAVREAAAAALAAVQPAPPSWTAGPLAAALADTDPRVVAAAQAALELVGPVDAHTAEMVSSDLYSGDPLLRSRAVRTLGAVAGATEAGLSLLIWSLGDADAGVRWQAATALGELGPAAIEASYDLAAMVQDPAETQAVRDAAGLALASILQ